MIKNLASNLVLEEVLNPEQLQAFLLFPFKLYKGTAWVPPLINEQERFFFSANPFWRHAEKVLYLAYNDKRQVVGRIAGFVNQRYLSFSNKKTGHFGFFECKNNPFVALLLMDAVKHWLHKQGIRHILGPLNGSIDHECGFLMNNFASSPKPNIPYSFPYYPDLMKTLGFKKAKDLYAYTINVQKAVKQIAQHSPPSQSHSEHDQHLDFILRMANKKSVKTEAEIIRTIFNEAMGAMHHYQFAPVSRAVFLDETIDLLDLVDPSMVLFAEKIAKKKHLPVGFVVAYPNFNKITKYFGGKLGWWQKLLFALCSPAIREARLSLICILPLSAGCGIGSALMRQLIETLHRKGYKELEYSWVLEDNLASQKLAERFGGKVYKTYRLFEQHF